ncbi:replication protein A 14 kDa subunit [Corvus cornix cornix]|uniref:replication protein A 14 kDa subunit n=1 Tax=Corvus cornix cornix TaxID=932674 RepID=UPI0018BE1A95|nr:replication protein A 14 kDa subunit [Corvus cornix cornix]XP_041899084.1 replication protein A 14 kDa subunit [Corvus kubaryi]XP_048160870.1 replication protein A 14 kDa subunit [Corvus hawaiiensis]
MGDIHEVPRPRIGTGQLAQHIGQPVCFVGRVEKIHPSGKLVVLSDGLGKHTTVELSEPLDEEISGVIEVVGRVTNQATIMCASYVQFREDKSLFDLELYNEALKIIHEFPEYFPFGTGRNT